MTRRKYPSDLTDKQWELLEPLIPDAKPGGRPREADVREVVSALLYRNGTGRQWNCLPYEFPLAGRCVRLEKIWADGRYAGTLVEIAQEWYHRVLEIVKRAPEEKGFAVQAHRWIVERTLAWFGNCRRLSKDYEELPQSSEGFIR